MAVYKIFAEKDATIYSAYPEVNTGRDAIISVENIDNSLIGLSTGVSRGLIKFSDSDILEVINNLVGNSNYSASLRLSLANAETLPLSSTVECFPVSGAWDMGIGKFGDLISATSGVTWQFRSLGTNLTWSTGSFTTGVTASFTNTTKGGGTWYSSSSTYGGLIRSTQSFNYNNDLDLNINVTYHIKEFLNDTIVNQGHILKLEPAVEYSTSSYGGLDYFSMDTRTIYPPCLEIKWRDYNFNTGSSERSIINTTPVKVTLDSNQYKYTQESVQRFRVNVRPQYPVRQFTTSSIYLNNYYLPTGSYYEVRDAKTKETVIEFDRAFTQISADSTSNYFDIYMNGLQPERYYTILIQTTIDGNTLILDQNLTFKVIS